MLENLSAELLWLIASKITSARDLGRLACVSKGLAAALADEETWRTACTAAGLPRSCPRPRASLRRVCTLESPEWALPPPESRAGPCARKHYAAFACNGGGTLVVFGGSRTGPSRDASFLNDCWALDVKSMRWYWAALEDQSPSARVFSADDGGGGVLRDAKGREFLLLHGGLRQEGFRDNDTFLLGPLGPAASADRWRWRRVGAGAPSARGSPEPRFHHQFTVVGPSLLAMSCGHNYMLAPLRDVALLSLRGLDLCPGLQDVPAEAEEGPDAEAEEMEEAEAAVRPDPPGGWGRGDDEYYAEGSVELDDEYYDEEDESNEELDDEYYDEDDETNEEQDGEHHEEEGAEETVEADPAEDADTVAGVEAEGDEVVVDGCEAADVEGDDTGKDESGDESEDEAADEQEAGMEADARRAHGGGGGGHVSSAHAPDVRAREAAPPPYASDGGSGSLDISAAALAQIKWTCDRSLRQAPLRSRRGERWDYPPTRARHTAVAWGRSLVLYGGESDHEVLGDVWLLDTVLGGWKEVRPSGGGGPRLMDAAAAMVGGTLVVAGGGSAQGRLASYLWTLNLATSGDSGWHALQPREGVARPLTTLFEPPPLTRTCMRIAQLHAGRTLLLVGGHTGRHLDAFRDPVGGHFTADATWALRVSGDPSREVSMVERCTPTTSAAGHGLFVSAEPTQFVACDARGLLLACAPGRSSLVVSRLSLHETPEHAVPPCHDAGNAAGSGAAKRRHPQRRGRPALSRSLSQLPAADEPVQDWPGPTGHTAAAQLNDRASGTSI